MYTEDLANASPKDFADKTMELWGVAWGPFYRMKKEENESKCVESFEKIAWSGYSVFGDLEDMFVSNRHPNLLSAGATPDYLELKEMLEKLIDKLATTTDGQTFAFASENPFDVQNNRKIVIPKEFKFLREGPGSELKVRLIYDQFMPFNNEHHKEEGCVAAEDLPGFYKEKGKKD